MVRLAEGEVTSRAARHDDYEDVMNLNKYVFAGNDYLYICYHDLIRDPRVHCFVGLLDDKVVAFSCAFMDGPTQYVGVGARVHTDYMRTPVFQTFAKLNLDYLVKNFPKLERRVWVGFDNDNYRNEAKMKARNTTILERWHTPYWPSPREKVEYLLKNAATVIKGSPLPVLDLALEDAIHVLCDSSNQKRLFPNGHIVGYYNGLPRRLNPFNIRQAVLSHSFRFSMRGNNGELAVVSFIVPHKVPDGVVCCMHYYHDKADLATFMAHFLEHMAHGVKTVPPDGIMISTIRCPTDVNMTKVKEVLKPYLGEARSDNNFRLGTGIFAWAPMPPAKL